MKAVRVKGFGGVDQLEFVELAGSGTTTGTGTNSRGSMRLELR